MLLIITGVSFPSIPVPRDDPANSDVSSFALRTNSCRVLTGVILTAVVVWSFMANSACLLLLSLFPSLSLTLPLSPTHLLGRTLTTRHGTVYLAFRLYGIWDQRRSAIKIIIGSFVVCYAPVVVLAVLAVQEYVRACLVFPFFLLLLFPFFSISLLPLETAFPLPQPGI